MGGRHAASTRILQIWVFLLHRWIVFPAEMVVAAALLSASARFTPPASARTQIFLTRGVVVMSANKYAPNQNAVTLDEATVEAVAAATSVEAVAAANTVEAVAAANTVDILTDEGPPGGGAREGQLSSVRQSAGDTAVAQHREVSSFFATLVEERGGSGPAGEDTPIEETLKAFIRQMSFLQSELEHVVSSGLASDKRRQWVADKKALEEEKAECRREWAALQGRQDDTAHAFELAASTAGGGSPVPAGALAPTSLWTATTILSKTSLREQVTLIEARVALSRRQSGLDAHDEELMQTAAVAERWPRCGRDKMRGRCRRRRALARRSCGGAVKMLFTPVAVSRRCASTRRSGRRASGGRRSSSSSRRCCPRCRRSSRTRAASTGTQPLCARASPRGTATRFGYSRSRRAQWGGPLESVGEPSAREPARESAPRSSAPAIELGAKMHHLRRLRNEVTLRYLCHVRYA